MRIVNVEVYNYRCIKSLTYKPSNHNIILGQVNSGKSSLLNALALALDPDIGRRFRPVEDLDFFEGKMSDAEKNPIPIKIEVTISECDETEKSYFFENWEPWDTIDSKILEEAEDIAILDDPRYKFSIRIGFYAYFDKEEKEVNCLWYYPKYSDIQNHEWCTCPRIDREKIGFFLIPAERDVNRALSFTRYSALDKALRIDKISIENEIKNIVSKIEGVPKSLFENKDFETLIKEIENRIALMIDLNPAVDRKLMFELSGLGQYDIMNILRAFVHTEGAERAYPIMNQGMGAKQIITMATLRMLADRKKSCILAIEEPENSLHPFTQRSLTNDLLKNSKTQIFITTHSTHVVEIAEHPNRYLFIDKGNGVKEIKTTLPKKCAQYDNETEIAIRKLELLHSSGLTDALFAPRILLVEGQHDRGVLPTIFRKLNTLTANKSLLDLDGLGVVPVNCTSVTEIPKIAPYFHELGKIVYALCDNRQDESNIAIKNCACIFLWPPRKELEDVLVDDVPIEFINEFTKYVSEFDDYFQKSATQTQTEPIKKDHVKTCLKKRNLHKCFIEFLPVEQFSSILNQFFYKLNQICRKQITETKIILDEATKKDS